MESLTSQTAKVPTLAVLGDLMLDEWIVGAATRISPEAPVPVLKFSSRRVTAGGAANVAANMRSLGTVPLLCGLVGTDASGDDLLDRLRVLGVEARWCVRDGSRPTTLKTRIVAGTQQVARVDREEDGFLSPEVGQQLSEMLPSLLEEAQLLCVSDYDKGMTTDLVMRCAGNIARERRCLLAGGPKPRNLARFAKFDWVSLNLKEAGEAANTLLRDNDEIAGAGEALRARLEIRALAITRGGRGATLCREGHAPVHLRGHEVEVFDVAGAGDSFLAGSCVALAQGADAVEAARYGNFAGACSVRHSGVVAVTASEVRALMEEAQRGMGEIP